MSGEVVFFKDLREPELLKQSKENPVRVVHLARIYGKYRNDFASGKFKEKLSYEIVSESGPDHDKNFVCKVFLNTNCIGEGEGSSKKHAEQMAAKKALALMGL